MSSPETETVAPRPETDLPFEERTTVGLLDKANDEVSLKGITPPDDIKSKAASKIEEIFLSERKLVDLEYEKKDEEIRKVQDDIRRLDRELKEYLKTVTEAWRKYMDVKDDGSTILDAEVEGIIAGFNRMRAKMTELCELTCENLRIIRRMVPKQFVIKIPS